MAGTTYMRSWQDFDKVSLAIIPLFLFSATFYPLTVYPGWLQVVVRCTPLYQGVALLRGLDLGIFGWSLLGHAVVPGRHGRRRAGRHRPPPGQAAAALSTHPLDASGVRAQEAPRRPRQCPGSVSTTYEPLSPIIDSNATPRRGVRIGKHPRERSLESPPLTIIRPRTARQARRERLTLMEVRR